MKNRNHFAIIAPCSGRNEKHIDWLVRAVVRAKKNCQNCLFDIYGKVRRRQAAFSGLMNWGRQTISISRACQSREKIYKNYEGLPVRSTSEGFGLTFDGSDWFWTSDYRF